MAQVDDEDYFIPLQDQCVFGAGIKRKRVPFVSASSLSSAATESVEDPKKDNSVNRYLSIVLPNEASAEVEVGLSKSSASATPVCSVCSLPLADSPTSSIVHETTIAHQACLPHSYPPSHLPREHIGFKYLSSYGWDPDSRLGLGSTGEGIRVPIKGKAKNDTVGLGVPERKKDEAMRRKEKERKLNAKEVRKRELEGKQKAERLREMFFRNEDVTKYLGNLG